MPGGFIKDLAVAILHKFAAYNVLGKEQTSKVNTTEVFLLWRAKNKNKVCPTNFIWTRMEIIQRRMVYHTSICQIVTGLAIHFGLLDPNRPPSSGHALVRSHPIDFVELEGALLVYDDTRLFPHAERHCVRAAVGPSKEPEIDIQLSPEIERDPEPIIAPLMMHVEGFKFL